MYMGGMATLKMPDGSIRSVDMSDPNFGPLVHAQGAVPLKPDGTPYSVTQAFGGDLWDGCPIQVAIEEAATHTQNTWVISQLEVMRAAGLVPGCLVPGSPNYSAFYVSEPGMPDSGTGIRRTITGGGGTNLVQPAVLPTGISTPSITPLPGGGVAYMPPMSEPEPSYIEEASFGGDGVLPWLLAGGLLFTLMGSRKQR